MIQNYRLTCLVVGDIVHLSAPGDSILVLNTLPVIQDLMDRRSRKYSSRVQMPAFKLRVQFSQLDFLESILTLADTLLPASILTGILEYCLMALCGAHIGESSLSL